MWRALVVALVLVACSGPTSAENAAPKGKSILAVMVGDSITYGYDCTGTPALFDGYRKYLDLHARRDGYTLTTWVGDISNASAYTPTKNHEGISGDSCADKLPGAPATNLSGNATDPINNWLGVGKIAHGVQIIMLNLCTNPEHSGVYSTNYKTLVEDMHSLEPQAVYVVNTCFSGQFATDNPILANSGGVWDQLAAEGITLYRVTTTLVAGDLCDGTHPSPPGAVTTGYDHLGSDVYPSLKAAMDAL